MGTSPTCIWLSVTVVANVQFISIEIITQVKWKNFLYTYWLSRKHYEYQHRNINLIRYKRKERKRKHIAGSAITCMASTVNVIKAKDAYSAGTSIIERRINQLFRISKAPRIHRRYHPFRYSLCMTELSSLAGRYWPHN